ncbi:hypothetical protein [Pseudarthrobacter polychromogenes]|uniref:Uncharacterized protein n=1 Tax=Pseudarthrobacter polychromogenes TaxID=1676 RepID=A0ABQ1Y2H0_9MICC|nr:hypothetical protein [Pseudarthrobacter polychromogenes]GGH10259.1 hypothetical protein GCM10011577_38980 [Pseudarthrobacter polychromogenes]
MSFTVNGEYLAKALQAVAAHAYKSDDVPHLSTLLFNVNESEELLITASNGSTTGVAFVDLWDSDGTLDAFAISLKDVGAILKVFPGKVAGVDEVSIRFETEAATDFSNIISRDDEAARAVRASKIRITDVSGMIPGKSLTLKQAWIGDRDVEQLWHHIAVRTRRLGTVPRRTAVSSQNVALFKTAAAVYKEPLIFEMGDSTGTLIVRCGEHFIGLLTPTHLDDDVTALYDKFRSEWKDRLPARLAAVQDA